MRRIYANIMYLDLRTWWKWSKRANMWGNYRSFIYLNYHSSTYFFIGEIYWSISHLNDSKYGLKSIAIVIGVWILWCLKSRWLKHNRLILYLSIDPNVLHWWNIRLLSTGWLDLDELLSISQSALSQRALTTLTTFSLSLNAQM